MCFCDVFSGIVPPSGVFPTHAREQTAMAASDEGPAGTSLLATELWFILSNET